MLNEGPCKKCKDVVDSVGSGAKISYVFDKNEAQKILDGVKQWYQAQGIKYFFYLPAFLIVTLGGAAGVLWLILQAIISLKRFYKTKKA